MTISLLFTDFSERVLDNISAFYPVKNVTSLSYMYVCTTGVFRVDGVLDFHVKLS